MKRPRPKPKHRTEHKPAAPRCECGEPVARRQDGTPSDWCDECKAKMAQGLTGFVDMNL